LANLCRIAAHRDIKAENVFIDGAGRLAVGDLGRVKFYELDEAAAAAGVAGAAAAAQHAAAVQTGVHTDFGAGNQTYMSSDYAANRRHNPAKEDVYCCGTLLAVMCGRFTHDERLDDARNRQYTAESIRRKGGEPLSRVYTCLVDKRPDMFLLEDIVDGRAAVAAGGADEERQWREIEAKAREGWYDRESRRGRLPDEGHFNTIWRDLEWLRTQLPASDDELKEAMPANFDMRLAPTLSDAMDHG
jgi:serine/threonine protein kinase